MQKDRIRKITLSAMFLAIGQILPFITGQIPTIGNMLSPMHFPIFLCAFVCGPYYAALVGFICPLLRSFLFTMPAMFPTAVAMAFELMAYGFACGYIYSLFKKKNIVAIYVSLIASMIIGRVVWGLVQTILSSYGNSIFTFEAFLTRGFINAIPGIIAQLIIIPAIVMYLNLNKKNR